MRGYGSLDRNIGRQKFVQSPTNETAKFQQLRINPVHSPKNQRIKEFEARIEKLKQDKLNQEEFYKNQLSSLREDKNSMQNFYEGKIKEFEILKKLDNEELESQRNLTSELEKELLKYKVKNNQAFNISTSAFSPTKKKLNNNEELESLLSENKKLKDEISEMKSDLLVLGELQENAEALIITNKQLNEEVELLRKSNYVVTKEQTSSTKLTIDQGIESYFKKEVGILESRLKEEYENCRKWRSKYFNCQLEIEEFKERERNYEVTSYRENLLLEKEKCQEEILLDFMEKEESLNKAISHLKVIIDEQQQKISGLEQIQESQSAKIKEYQAISIEELKARLSESLKTVEDYKAKIYELESQVHYKDSQIFDIKETEAKCEMLEIRNSRLNNEISRLKSLLDSNKQGEFIIKNDDEGKGMMKSPSDLKNPIKQRIFSSENVGKSHTMSYDKVKDPDFIRLKRQFEDISLENKRLSKVLMDEQKYSHNLQDKISKLSAKNKF